MYKIIYSCVIYVVLIKGVKLLDISNYTSTIIDNEQSVLNSKTEIIFIEDSYDAIHPPNGEDLDDDLWEDHIDIINLKKKCNDTLNYYNDDCSSYDEDDDFASNKKHTLYKNELNLKSFDVKQIIKRDTKTGFKGYGRWTKWTPCSRHCRTKRMRKCKRHSICGSAPFIRQSAYCFIEGTMCEKYISKKLNLSKRNKGTENPSSVLSKIANECGVPLDFHKKNHYNKNRNDISYLRNGKSYRNNHENGRRTNSHRDSSHNNQDMWFLLRIIGGRPARNGKWPWQVLLLNRHKEPFCGGTLIAPRWILTAAHCVRRRLYVRIREHDLSKREGPEMEFKIRDSFLHPSYDPETVDSDIALLRLPTAIESDNVGYACLPSVPYGQRISGNLDNLMCAITGWGKANINHHKGTNVLHEAQISIIPDRECHRAYSEYHITKNMFCGGTRGGTRDSCAGDSGGPLVCKASDGKWFVYGITSFGEGCGRRGKFGIYTKLANYISWVHQTVDRYN